MIRVYDTLRMFGAEVYINMNLYLYDFYLHICDIMLCVFVKIWGLYTINLPPGPEGKQLWHLSCLKECPQRFNFQQRYPQQVITQYWMREYLAIWFFSTLKHPLTSWFLFITSLNQAFRNTSYDWWTVRNCFSMDDKRIRFL